MLVRITFALGRDPEVALLQLVATASEARSSPSVHISNAHEVNQSDVCVLSYIIYQ